MTKLATGEGDIQLTISSNSCPATFTYNTVEITGQPKIVAGLPAVNSDQPLLIYFGPGDENEVCRYTENTINFSTGTGSTTDWTYVSHSGSPQPSWSPVNSDDLYLIFFHSRQNTIVLKMTTSNTCGSTIYNFGFKAIDCGSMRTASPAKEFSVSPNPLSDLLTVNSITDRYLNSENAKQITEVIISDFNSQIVMRKKFDNANTAQFHTSSLRQGSYIVTIISGKYQETHTITKQ